MDSLRQLIYWMQIMEFFLGTLFGVGITLAATSPTFKAWVKTKWDKIRS